MMHNLEGISFDEVVNQQGESYSAFRLRAKPIYYKVWLDIAKGYFFLAAVVMLYLYLDHRFHSWWWAYIIPLGLFTGYIAAYLALYIHEAGHFNAHPDKKKNDRLATIFLCLPFGLSIKSYRKIHWQHHVHLGTPQDTEVSYTNPLTRLFILETLTGIHLLRTVRKKGNDGVLTPEQKRESRNMLLAGLLFHAGIITIMLLMGHWTFLFIWCSGFGVFFPFFATIRQILEHRDELAHHATDFTKVAHGKISRLFVHTVLSSSFGAAGFTRHMIHHWDPQLSYTQLGAAEAFLLNCEQTAPILNTSRTSYLQTAKKLLAAP
ncbi:MAG: fatty acid desaturase [Bacteroidetes bacterium]|nr:fatty acid desaturase [Bacteroidota bacterium]